MKSYVYDEKMFESKEYEQVKKDFKECKEKVDKLEWFLERIAKSFISEYGY